MQDILIIPEVTGNVSFSVLGKSDDTGFMLLQRLYVLLLSDTSTGLRGSNTGYSLMSFLEGGNIPSDGAMDAVQAVSCSNAVSSLDEEDRNNIESFTGASTDGSILCTQVLVDGTTLQGLISHVNV